VGIVGVWSTAASPARSPPCQPPAAVGN